MSRPTAPVTRWREPDASRVAPSLTLGYLTGPDGDGYYSITTDPAQETASLHLVGDRFEITAAPTGPLGTLVRGGSGRFQILGGV